MDNVLDKLLKDSYQEFQKSTTSLIRNIETPTCIFDLFFKKCQQYHSQAVHNFQEMKEIRSTKSKGDLFELFCVRYLTVIKGFQKVWLLKELSEELKAQLKLPLGQKDYGIDLIGFDPSNQPQYSAIQCKFKAPRAPIKVKNNKGENRVIYPCVNWKELSTFNELCNASGPWKQKITITTAPSVRRLGGIKDEKDKSICIGSFRSITPENWLKLMQCEGAPPKKIAIKLKNEQTSKSVPNSVVVAPPTNILTQQQLREKRLSFYNKQK